MEIYGENGTNLSDLGLSKESLSPSIGEGHAIILLHLHVPPKSKAKITWHRKQPNGGYTVQTNVFDETIYANIRTKRGTWAYRDQYVGPLVESRIAEMLKKTRDIEFERGLRDKLKQCQGDKVLGILGK